VAAFAAMGGVFQALVENTGLPGAFLFLAYYFVDRNATVEQKQAIIDIYVLWRGSGHVIPTAIFCVVVVLLAFAQRHYYLRQIRLCRDEIKRIGEEKSALQAKLMDPVQTHHTDA
jgi:hypothetical protein